MTTQTTTTQVHYWPGTRRRKTETARVRIFENVKDGISINGQKKELDKRVLAPFELVGKLGSFGMSVKVNGGGKFSQLDAIRHGIARALEQYNPELRTTLKKAGFLTRDPREKERKKPGLKRARRAPQWAKR